MGRSRPIHGHPRKDSHIIGSSSRIVVVAASFYWSRLGKSLKSFVRATCLWFIAIFVCRLSTVMPETDPRALSTQRKRRGVVKASIIRLGSRLKELESKVEEPTTHDHAQRLAAKLETLRLWRSKKLSINMTMTSPPSLSAFSD